MLIPFKAVATKTDVGMQVECESRNFKIIIDEPPESGGADTGMTPVEAQLCALGACQSIVAAAFAESQNFKFEKFYVEIEGDLDPDGFMGLADVPKGFQEIRFTMHFKTDEPQEKCEAFARFIQNTCPIGETLKTGVSLVCTGVVKD